MLVLATGLPNVKDELLAFIPREAGAANGRGRAEAQRARLTISSTVDDDHGPTGVNSRWTHTLTVPFDGRITGTCAQDRLWTSPYDARPVN